MNNELLVPSMHKLGKRIPIKTNNENIISLCNKAFIHLATYFNLQKGMLFLKTNIEGHTYLKEAASYNIPIGYDKVQGFKIGVGLIGSCYQIQRHIKINNVPEQYFHKFAKNKKHTATPKQIICFPLTIKNLKVGVLETAFKNSLSEFEIENVHTYCHSFLKEYCFQNIK